MRSPRSELVGILVVWAGLVGSSPAGTLTGHVRDLNWYARYQANPYGVGVYEFAVNANASNVLSGWGAAATDVFGAFQMANLPAGLYTVASWDVWWRSAYAFHVAVPASGSTPDVDLRLGATLWGYPAFWEDTPWHEFGQTFVASGPITMIYLRNPLLNGPRLTLTVHEGGPGGPPVGIGYSFSDYWDVRRIYGYGQMPTVRGRRYYLRLRTDSPSAKAILCQMDPRPDFSDPMPEGCLYLGDGTTLTAYPDRDLGVVIMADDDGLVTDLFCRPNGEAVSGLSSLGQTFVARGVSLVSAAFWLADPSGPTYLVRVREGGPSGPQVGSAKRGKPARPTADPEMLVCWAPGECPLTPGHTYYIEVTRDGGGIFNVAYVNRTDPFPYGQAYANGAPLSGVDVAGTLMEEESPGSATQPRVRFTVEPAVSEAQRGTNELTISWSTDVPSDSLVEYALDNPPYTHTHYSPSLTTNHLVRLTRLQSHALYHFRVKSSRAGYRPAVSRDQVVCTRPARPNLLVNPGFELGSGPSPRRTIVGWTATAPDNIQASDGTWYFGLPPRTGSWLVQYAVNGASSDGYLYQRVTNISPGRVYTFSAWCTTWMRENDTFKYDEWDERGRLIYMRLGLDPSGGTNPASAAVQWTPRFYSHLHYTPVAKSVVAQTNALTVFVHMQGQGGQWHLYGIDDCALSTEDPAPVEPFDELPIWDSSYDTPSPTSAVWQVVAEGQAGPGLQASRLEPGLSIRALVFPVQPNTNYAVSVYMRCPTSADLYEALTAVKPGLGVASELETAPAGWIVLQRFANPGSNGNGGQWVQYGTVLASGSATQLTVALKLASVTGTGPVVGWDTVRLDPVVIPRPVLALADRASNTITVRFSSLVQPSATNPANYTVAVSGGPAVVVLGAEWVDAQTVRLHTGPQLSRADYLVTVSNVLDASQSAQLSFLNGQTPVRVVYPLVRLEPTELWRYEQSGADLGTAWRWLTYDDRAWPSGPPLLGYETCPGTCLPDLIRTPLTLGTNKITFYFRKPFTVPSRLWAVPLRLVHVVDDGAVFYLNGLELHRIGMTNPITASTLAARTVGDATLEGPFEVGPVTLLAGTNVLAAEVHQANPTSSDLVFGAALEALLRPSQVPVLPVRLDIRRHGDQVVLDWAAPGFYLETAPAVKGPWTRVPEAQPPWAVEPTEPMRFYRLTD